MTSRRHRPNLLKARAASDAGPISRVKTLPDLPSCRSFGLRVVGLALLAVGAAAPMRAGNSVPDWVKAAAAQPIPDLPRSTKAVVLLDEETYTVAADGRATVHVRNVTKILRPQGRDAALPVVRYDKDEKILSMHVWSIDPAGHEYALKDNELLDLGAPGEAGELYSDERARAASPPGLDPGGIVALEYERRERPYLAEANWAFQGPLPTVTQSFTLVLPAGFAYTTTWAHHAKVSETTVSANTFRWEVDHQPAIDLNEVPLAPPEDALAGRMAVHYGGPTLAQPQDGTWEGIGRWYDTLYRDRATASPAIAAKAAELTAGKSDFFEKSQAIAEFMQKQIRYFVVEIGVGGYQPHPADQIFRDRYGDCKDKTTLLVALLSSVGIHAAPVMVHTERGVVDPDGPSIVGNHIIGAIQIPDGYQSDKMHSVITAKSGRRYLIFDPTWYLTPFGQLESNLQGSYGLLLEGDASQVVQLPLMSPDLNRVERSGTFQLAADGTLKGTITEKRFGDVAEQRRNIFGKDLQQQQKYLDRSMAHDFMSANVSGLKVENAQELKQDLTVSFQVEAGHFGSTTGPLLMVRPRVYGSEDIPTDQKRRKVPIDLGETLQAHDDFNIQLPEGYAVDELPDPVKADFGFASYESSTEVHGRTLHFSRTYVVKQVTLPADKYEEVQKLSGLIAFDEQNRAILKRAN